MRQVGSGRTGVHDLESDGSLAVGIVHIWWGEAPERPEDSTEASDDDRFDGDVTPKNAPSRGPALGPRLGARIVLASPDLSRNESLRDAHRLFGSLAPPKFG
jgi:hypothetical protein